MDIINNKVFVQKLTIEDRQIFIPRSDFYKIIYIESNKYIVENNNETFSVEKDDYIVLENDNYLKIKVDNEVNNKGEIILIYIHPEYVRGISSEDCNLETCFIEARDSDIRIVRASSEVYMLIKSLTTRLICYEKMEGFGREEILKSTLTILLVITNRGYIESRLNKKRIHDKLDIIDDIFIYINTHISEEITLDDLAKEFFMNKFHLSKIFKDATNMTIHSCILKRKLSYSKELIEKNIPIIEVYSKCGFGGYTHFFRAFKKEFGMTPRQYYHKAVNLKK